jgi:putative DNA primase/helicase
VSDTARALSFEEIATANFPPADPVLIHTASGAPVLCTGHLGQVSGPRGLGKSWFGRTWAVVIASGGSALGYDAPRPRRVLYLDGEMAQEDIQERDITLAGMIHIPHTPELETIAADWQDEPLPRIDTPEGQAFIAEYVEWAEVIIVDNRSCLFDSAGEKDAEAWEPAAQWLMQQRRDKKAVMMVHHANRLGTARGISKPEDPLNLMIELTRPKDYSPEQGARFNVEFTKHRNIRGGEAAKGYTARLTPEGWVIEAALSTAEKRLLEKVREAWTSGTPFRSKSDGVKRAGDNRSTTLSAWDRLEGTGMIRPMLSAEGREYKAA